MQKEQEEAVTHNGALSQHRIYGGDMSRKFLCLLSMAAMLSMYYSIAAPCQGKDKRLSVDRAIHIAMKHMRSKGKISDTEEYTIRCVRDNDSNEWRFYFQFLPPTPDALLSVFVMDSGKVIISR